MRGFTDIHSHFVYGVDDGARTRAEMEAMLDAAYADGIAAVFATPHVTPGVRAFASERFARHLEEARAYCRERGYGIALHEGAEILYTPAIERIALERRLPELGRTGYVLVEFAPEIGYSEMDGAIGVLRRAGYAVILAHVERYWCLYSWKNAAKLREKYGVKYQVNCSTIVEGCSFFRGMKLRQWFEEGLVDCVASDAHGSRKRPFQMRAAYRALRDVYGRKYADRLTKLL